MKEYTNGEDVVMITKDLHVDLIEKLETENKPKNLTVEEKKSDVEVDITREEIKVYVRDLKLLKSNVKKMYSLVFGNCTDGVPTLHKAEELYEEKYCAFDCTWLLKIIKSIVSVIDTKMIPIVSLHTAMMYFLFLKQYGNEANDAYLTRFKPGAKTLNSAGGGHLFISE